MTGIPFFGLAVRVVCFFPVYRKIKASLRSVAFCFFSLSWLGFIITCFNPLVNPFLNILSPDFRRYVTNFHLYIGRFVRIVTGVIPFYTLFRPRSGPFFRTKIPIRCSRTGIKIFSENFLT